MIKNKLYLDLFLIIFIIFFAVYFRITTVNRPINDRMAWRQSEIYSMAFNFARNDPNILNPSVFRILPDKNLKGLYLLEFPIYEYLLSLVIRLFGDNIAYLRLFSILLAALSSISVFLIARKFTDRSAAFISAFIFNLLPSAVFWGRALSHDFFAMSLSTLAIAIVILKKSKFRYLVISSLLLGIVIATKPLYAALIFLAPFLVDKKMFEVKLIRKVALISICLIGPFFVWIIRRHSVPSEILETTNLLFYVSGGSNYFQYLKDNDVVEYLLKNRLMGEVLTTLGGIILIIMIPVLSERKNPYDRFLLSWLSLVFTSIILFAWGNFNHDYYQIIILPIASLIIGHFLILLLKFLLKLRIIFSTAGFILFIFFGYYLWKLPFYKSLDDYYHPEVKYSEFSSDIDKVTSFVPENKYIGVFSYTDVETDPALINRLSRRGWNLYVSGDCDAGEWLSVLQNPNYALASFIILPKERYRMNNKNYCNYRPVESKILLEGQYSKVYEGDYLILFQKKTI